LVLSEAPLPSPDPPEPQPPEKRGLIKRAIAWALGKRPEG
jgi:hypothetical protein